MKLSHLDLNLLKVFDAILTHGSLTVAGDSLGVSQPAVSHALRRLRAAYNDELFLRTPEGMKPTPFANEIAGHIRDALERVSLTIGGATEFDPQASRRHFRFHMGDLAEALVTPVLLRQMSESAPNMSIEVTQNNNADVVREISTGLLDFAIERLIPCNSGNRAQTNSVRCQLIWEDEFVCAVRHGHPEFSGREEISIEEYLAANHIGAWSSHNSKCDVDAALSDLGLQRRIMFQSQYFLDAPTAANNSDCMLTIPRSLARHANLEIFDLPFEVAKMSYYMYSLQECQSDPAYNWMKSLLLQLFQSCKEARKRMQRDGEPLAVAGASA